MRMDGRGSLHNVIFLHFFISLAAVSSVRTVCPVNSQQFLTRNRTLLPLENLQASSEHTGFNPTENFISADSPWCSTINLPSAVGQYIELNFTEPVAIGLVVSGGFLSSYVNNFTILYTLSSIGDDFQPYGVLKTPQDFIVTDITTTDAHFVLEETFHARRVRFVVNGGIMDRLSRVCWEILILGCTINRAQAGVSETTLPLDTTTTHSSASTNGGLTTDSTPTNTPVCPEADTILRKDLLLIVVPTAVVLLIIVLIVATIAVLICCCCARSAESEKPVYETVKVQLVNGRTRELVENGTTTPSSVSFHYDNPRPLFYDVPRSSIRSRHGSGGSLSTIGSNVEVKNPAYQTKKSAQDFDVFLPDDGNDYEVIPDHPTELDKRTKFNTSQNSSALQQLQQQGVVCNSPPPPPPPHTTNVMNGQISTEENGTHTLEQGVKSASTTELTYTKVKKANQSEEKMDYERAQSTANIHYATTTTTNTNTNDIALAEEIDHLSRELERNRPIITEC